MIGTLRVLLVEDSEDDAMLLLRELRRGGYQPLSRRVCTPKDMEKALRSADARDELFQVVISDYYMPRFRAPDALRLLRELGYDVPFIVVSGKIGEDVAVEIMKAGANDYLTKENMSRLCPAIECELREAEVRRERERAEKALGLSEDRFRHLVEQIPAVTYVQEPIDSDTPKTITYMSPQYEAMLGYPPEKEVLEEDHWLRVLHPDDRERVLAEELRTDETGEPYRIEYRQIARGGRVVWVRGEATLVRNEEGNSLYWLGVQYGITEQKQTEEFRESEERFRATFEQAAVGIVQVGLDGEWLRFNDKFCDIVGYEREELSAMSVFQLIFPDGFERLRQGRQDTDGGVQELYQGEAHRRQGREARPDQPDRLPGARRRGRATLLYRGRRGYRKAQAGRRGASENPGTAQTERRALQGTRPGGVRSPEDHREAYSPRKSGASGPRRAPRQQGHRGEAAPHRRDRTHPHGQHTQQARCPL